MARLGARVPEAQGMTGVIEGPLELAAAVREHALMALFFSSPRCQHYDAPGQSRANYIRRMPCPNRS